MISRNLVTLQQARDQLRSDGNADDADLLLKIAAASEAVLAYLDGAEKAFMQPDGTLLVDSQGMPQGVPARVQLATLVTVASFYNERDGQQSARVDAQHGYGYALPQAATSLIYSMRIPSV